MARQIGTIGSATYVPQLYLDMPNVFAPASGKYEFFSPRNNKNPLDQYKTNPKEGITIYSEDGSGQKIRWEKKPISADRFMPGGSIGLQQSSMPDVYDDPVSMVSTAFLWLMQRYQIDPRQVKWVGVGSESLIDGAKAMASYAKGNLEKFYGDGTLDQAGVSGTTKACIGATIEQRNAVNSFRGEDPEFEGDDIVLIGATDKAWYRLGSSGEWTQGGFAHAKAVGNVGELGGLTRVGTASGNCARDINDFLRPENSEFPEVDGRGSIRAYLEAMRDATLKYNEDVSRRRAYQQFNHGRKLTDSIDKFVFHIPFPTMAATAGVGGYWNNARGTELGAELETLVGSSEQARIPEPPKPRRRDFEVHGEFQEALNEWKVEHGDWEKLDAAWWEKKKEFLDAVKKTPQFKEFYDDKIETSLYNNRRLGNGYTASVHAGLEGVFEHARDHGKSLSGQRILVGSYGSGLFARVHDETVMDNYAQFAQKLDTHRQLDGRKSLTFDEYIKLRTGQPKEPFTNPRSMQFVWTGAFGDKGQRVYDLAEKGEAVQFTPPKKDVPILVTQLA